MVNDIIVNEYERVVQKHPRLHFPKPLGELWSIEGIIDVIDDEGYHWDSFSVQIIGTKNYPNELPIIIETGKKIPRTAEWHNGGGICCLGTAAKLHRELGYQPTFLQWLDGQVVPYFANYLFRVLKGRYSNDEFAHAEVGIIQYYLELFTLKSLDDVINRMTAILDTRHSKAAYCFCGSGKLYRKCYLENTKKHTYSIPSYIMKRDLNALIAFKNMVLQPPLLYGKFSPKIGLKTPMIFGV